MFRERNTLFLFESCLETPKFFSWDDQITICRRMIKILKAQKGSMVLRRQTGNVGGYGIENTG